VFKVLLHLLAVNIVDVQVNYRQTSLPPLIAVCEIGVLNIKNAINEGEVIFYFLIALNMETKMACRGLVSETVAWRSDMVNNYIPQW